MSSNCHNSVNLCSIFKNYLSKSKLSFLLSNYPYFVNISSFKVEQRLCTIVHFFGTPSMKFALNEFAVVNIIINVSNVLDKKFYLASVLSFLLTEWHKVADRLRSDLKCVHTVEAELYHRTEWN